MPFTTGKQNKRGDVEVILDGTRLMLPLKFAARIVQLEATARAVVVSTINARTHQGHEGTFEDCLVLICIQAKQRQAAMARA
jgi:hypothetical protein